MITPIMHGKKDYLIIAFALAIITAYMLPYFIFWEDSHILIHDNLDSVFVWHKVLLESGQTFAPNHALIEQVMGGMPRSSFPLEFIFTLLWFWLFGPFGAYLFNRSLISLVGFLGMYLLLRKHIIPHKEDTFIQIAVATTFGLLPFWPFAGLSVAGLPFLLFAFLNLRSGEKNPYYNWLIIAIYPFYASLIFTGIFFIAIILFLVAYDYRQVKRFNWKIIFGLGLITLLFIFSHYRLFYAFLFDTSYVSHRNEFSSNAFLASSLLHAIKFFLMLLIKGQYHAISLQKLIVLPVVLFGFILMWEFKKIDKCYIVALSFIVITSFFYGIWGWIGIAAVRELLESMLPVQIDRFYCIHPLFWYILFAVSLSIIQKTMRIGKWLVWSTLCFQLLYACSYHEILKNRNDPTFQEFFAEEQFSKIKAYINKPLDKYRVISVGIHPSISQYNEFYTLDGYLADYPLAYKHKYREIIAKELAKNEKNRLYFDAWGSRAYIFTSQDIGYLNKKNNNITIERLDLNVAKLKEMGGKYILSAVKIDIKNNPEYQFEKVFICEKSAWDIYLYKIL